MNNRGPRILIVDNYDSFTFNLVQLLQQQGGCSFDVIKNDEVNIQKASIYNGFLFSPGPGVPDDAPVMRELLRHYQCRKSFLGICLGHQAIAETYGMKLKKLDTVKHGLRTIVRIIDRTDYLFEGIPSEFSAGLYHSWAVSEEQAKSIPDLRITALSNDGIIMAVSHLIYNIRGVQFHPESYLSEYGRQIMHNWIKNL